MTGLNDGGMLDLRGDDMCVWNLPGEKNTFQNLVIGFAATAGKYNLCCFAAQ